MDDPTAGTLTDTEIETVWTASAVTDDPGDDTTDTADPGDTADDTTDDTTDTADDAA